MPCSAPNRRGRCSQPPTFSGREFSGEVRLGCGSSSGSSARVLIRPPPTESNSLIIIVYGMHAGRKLFGRPQNCGLESRCFSDPRAQRGTDRNSLWSPTGPKNRRIESGIRGMHRETIRFHSTWVNVRGEDPQGRQTTTRLNGHLTRECRFASLHGYCLGRELSASHSERMLLSFRTSRWGRGGDAVNSRSIFFDGIRSFIE